MTKAPVVPKQIATALAAAAQYIYWPTISPDEIERRFINDVLARPLPRPLQAWEHADDFVQEPEIPGDWDKVGVVPEDIEQYALLYLRQFRTMCVQLGLKLSLLTLIRFQQQLLSPGCYAQGRRESICEFACSRGSSSS